MDKVEWDTPMPGNTEYRANHAKLTQLAEDAQTKAESYEPFTGKADENSFHYYQGMRDGLRRALNVIEGKG